MNNQERKGDTMFYENYKSVTAEKTNSSYGNWMVKTSEVTFRFFWKKTDAVIFAKKHNELEIVNGKI